MPGIPQERWTDLDSVLSNDLDGLHCDEYFCQSVEEYLAYFLGKRQPVSSLLLRSYS
jgi:hypothetical protein